MAETKISQVFGVIGGSGVYDIEGLTNKEWRKVASPFGEPSDALLFGELNGQRMVFLPRQDRYFILILVDEPKGNKESFGFATGGWAAAPAMGRVAERIAPYLGVRRAEIPTDVAPVTPERLTGGER